MKKFILVMCVFACRILAYELNIYDAQGNLIGQTTSQHASSWMQNDKSQKIVYIAAKSADSKNQSYKTKAPRKMMGKKHWYEVDWNQGIKICPEKKFNKEDGVWIVNGSASVDSLNCVYIDGSPYTRSILALYSRDLNDLTEADSCWILVNQSIVELTGKTFKVRKAFNRNCVDGNCDIFLTQDIKFEYDLIVDKTEMRFRDAMWLQDFSSDLRKIRNIVTDYDYKTSIDWSDKAFYPSVDFNEILDYPVPSDAKLVMLRSLKDGLDVSWAGYVPMDSARVKGFVLQKMTTSKNVNAWNLSSNGYRFPTVDEWSVLMNGGVANVFVWGDSVDEKKLGKEMNIGCSDKTPGLYPVRKYAPNAYGLYDVYGNAEERVFDFYKDSEDSGIILFSLAPYCGGYKESKFIRPVCRAMRPYACAKKNKPRLEKKYDTFYNGFVGMRAVRILE